MKEKIPAMPYLIWTLIFTLIPLILVIYFAFTNQSGEFTVNNFASVSAFAPVIMRSITRFNINFNMFDFSLSFILLYFKAK